MTEPTTKRDLAVEMTEEESLFSVLYASSHHKANLKAYWDAYNARLALDAAQRRLKSAQGRLKSAEAKLRESAVPVEESTEYKAWIKAWLEAKDD
jgi:hypothetical protein